MNAVKSLLVAASVLLAMLALAIGYPMAKAYFDCTVGAPDAARAMARGAPDQQQHACTDALTFGEAVRRTTQ